MNVFWISKKVLSVDMFHNGFLYDRHAQLVKGEYRPRTCPMTPRQVVVDNHVK